MLLQVGLAQKAPPRYRLEVVLRLGLILLQFAKVLLPIVKQRGRLSAMVLHRALRQSWLQLPARAWLLGQEGNILEDLATLLHKQARRRHFRLKALRGMVCRTYSHTLWNDTFHQTSSCTANDFVNGTTDSLLAVTDLFVMSSTDSIVGAISGFLASNPLSTSIVRL